MVAKIFAVSKTIRNKPRIIFFITKHKDPTTKLIPLQKMFYEIVLYFTLKTVVLMNE